MNAITNHNIQPTIIIEISHSYKICDEGTTG